MPILYGEGEKNALHRLQVEIFHAMTDYSIFEWIYTTMYDYLSTVCNQIVLTTITKIYSNNEFIYVIRTEFRRIQPRKPTPCIYSRL